MIGALIGFISCLLCAVPFYIISKYDKDSITPISFWSGDTTLKDKVNDVRSYNYEMADLYRKCAIVFVISGILFFLHPIAGIIAIIFDCTLGVYLVYVVYKKILIKYL